MRTERMLEEVFGGVAQLGEHLPCTQGVIGSNPFTSTRRQRVGAGRQGLKLRAQSRKDFYNYFLL